MSANFSAVIIDGNYTTLMQTITDLFKAVAQGLDPAVVTPLNTPANALRWELTTNKRLEKFNGTAWASAEPAGGFAMNISGSSSKWGTPRTITIGGDASGVSGAWDGSANLSFNITLATVPPNKGGTGIVSYTIGDIPYASGASTLSKLAGVAYGNVLLSGGVATASSWGKVGLTTHVSGVLGMSNGGHAGTTAAQARTNLGLVIGTDVMGMGGGTCTGPLAATNLSGTNTGDEAAASSTVAGVAELATQTEVNNGDATRIVTGATMAGRTATTTRAGVIATSTDSVAQASYPTAGSSISVNHGLGAIPVAVEIVYRCKTTEGGYAVGDEYRVAADFGSISGTGNSAVSVWANATQVGVSHWFAKPLTRKDGTSSFAPTAANWRTVLRAKLI